MMWKPNLGFYFDICLEGMRGNHGKPVRIGDIQNEIWSRDFQNSNDGGTTHTNMASY